RKAGCKLARLATSRPSAKVTFPPAAFTCACAECCISVCRPTIRFGPRPPNYGRRKESGPARTSPPTMPTRIKNENKTGSLMLLLVLVLVLEKFDCENEDDDEDDSGSARVRLHGRVTCRGKPFHRHAHLRHRHE